MENVEYAKEFVIKCCIIIVNHVHIKKEFVQCVARNFMIQQTMFNQTYNKNVNNLYLILALFEKY